MHMIAIHLSRPNDITHQLFNSSAYPGFNGCAYDPTYLYSRLFNCLRLIQQLKGEGSPQSDNKTDIMQSPLRL